MRTPNINRHGSKAHGMAHRPAGARAGGWSSPVDRLPDEVLARVFTLCDSETLLTAVPAVCSRWRRVCAAERIAARLDLSFVYDVVNLNRWIQATVARFPAAVYLKGCENLTDAAVVALAEGCNQLTSVDFSWCENLTDAAVVALVEGCNQLASVDFEGCVSLTDAALKLI